MMTSLEVFFALLIYYVNAAVVGAIVAFVLLVLARVLMNRADLNPFSRPVHRVRSMTDPFINPVRRALVGFGFKPGMAPLVAILIAILAGWLASTLLTDVLTTIYHVIVAGREGRPAAIVGWLLYGFLGVYSLAIFVRILFAWVMVSYSNRLMRLLVDATEPLLGPLRRLVPPRGRMDLSPLVAFLIIWVFRQAIAGTLLRF